MPGARDLLHTPAALDAAARPLDTASGGRVVRRWWDALASLFAEPQHLIDSPEEIARRERVQRQLWVEEEALRAARRHCTRDPELMAELFRQTARLLDLQCRVSVRRRTTVRP